MEFKDRRSVNDNVKRFGGYNDETIEIVEWANGEGWDICIDEKLMQLNYAELDAINYLIKSLEYDHPTNG